MTLNSIRVLDLFSGAGGLALGFDMAGFHIVEAIDNWQDALNTINSNCPKTNTSIMDLADESAITLKAEELGKIDVVIGGPPCQGFSIAGKRDPLDPRNKLYIGFLKFIELLRPSYFLMENVPTISSPANKELFDAINQDLIDLGYDISCQVLLASDYGVPQNRRRMFLVGSKVGLTKFTFPEPTGPRVTTEEAISDLSEGDLMDGHEYVCGPKSEYQTKMRIGSGGIYNHQVTVHNSRTVEIISLVPDGGNFKDLPTEYQGIRNVNIAWTRFSSTSPSFTIDTGHRHHFHYKWNRVPTARESARLQSFPDRYVFTGSKTSQLRQIGNAVPPLLANVLALKIKEAFSS